MPNILTQTQSDQFWNDGYVFPFDCLTTEEAQACRDKLEAYEATLDGEITKHVRVKCHLAFQWLWDIAHHPKILDAVEDLIGPDILLYLSTFWFKDAKDGKFVSWHQDSAYYGLDPHDEVTAWVALTPANRKNGCMRVIPGSHLGPDLVHDETYDPQNLLARGQTIRGLDEDGAEFMELEAGEFSLHHERTAHGSRANETDLPRVGIAFFYMPAHCTSTIGRRSALPMRGQDHHGHWDQDPLPQEDLDPTCMAFLKDMWTRYQDTVVAQEAERTR